MTRARYALTSAAAIAAELIPLGCASAQPPQPPAPLPPNAQGYVRVETASRTTGCSVSAHIVACQRFSGYWQASDGQRRHTVSVSANGDFHWVDADLGELQGRVPLENRTYRAAGWTIAAGPDSTRFTNDRTDRGFSVSELDVTPF